MERLPYIDEHARRIAAPRAQVWAALEATVAAYLNAIETGRMGRVLGTRPRAGFAIVDASPGVRLELRGRHRFSRYALSFELADADDGAATQLRAQTHAAFPGPHGRAYRALVIGTRGHILAVNNLLRSVARRTR